jgi:hypothetical protein
MRAPINNNIIHNKIFKAVISKQLDRCTDDQQIRNVLCDNIEKIDQWRNEKNDRQI